MFLRRAEFPGEESTWMESGRRPLLLREHHSYPGGRGVDFYDEGQFGIRMDKERCAGESLLEGVKCFGGNGVPGQGLGLAFEQVGEGTGDGPLTAEPESRRAEMEITVLETVSWAQVESGFILWIEGWMALTKDRGGRRGHASIMCPLAPEHRCCESRLCLSDVVRRLESVCIGSGGLWPFGGRLGGGAMAVETSGEQDNMPWEHRMANWMDLSSPWVSS